MNTPLFGISGFKNSGKTTLTAKLISALSDRGLRVSSVKHAHHEFDLDQPGTDTDQHRSAGAYEVVIASARRWAIMHEIGETEKEPSLDEMTAHMASTDLILVEGYKTEHHPKLLLVSNQEQLDLLSNIKNLIAIAAEPDLNIKSVNLPRFDRNDIDSIAQFIVETFSLQEMS